ncbi:uncharacterized protein G2W53_010086 [Senna tora]|uniref:Uncharacterized protein n=1 Tax=Senna tora TaxID=362788 RepID=A0A834X0A3_9FABA|nr:uncharacterized protein G2W53_010086 [Senna tora]
MKICVNSVIIVGKLDSEKDCEEAKANKKICQDNSLHLRPWFKGNQIGRKIITKTYCEAEKENKGEKIDRKRKYDSQEDSRSKMTKKSKRTTEGHQNVRRIQKE